MGLLSLLTGRVGRLSDRKLGTAGQRMGASAALCHIRHDPVAPSEHGGCFTLKAANAGWCQAVLCRGGRAVPLSRTQTVEDEAAYLRVRQHNAVVTEVSATVLREHVAWTVTVLCCLSRTTEWVA